MTKQKRQEKKLNSLKQKNKNGFKRTNLEKMIGKVFSKVEQIRNQEIIFHLQDTNESKFVKFHHEQECCEDVYIESVSGNLSDLENTPILRAEEYTNLNDSHTFYKFSTIKGFVDIRWVGESNGQYSVEVNIEYIGL